MIKTNTLADQRDDYFIQAGDVFVDLDSNYWLFDGARWVFKPDTATSPGTNTAVKSDTLGPASKAIDNSVQCDCGGSKARTPHSHWCSANT